MTTRQEEIDAFLAAVGYGEAARYPLDGDASFRRYIRIREPARTAMLMDAPPGKEDIRPFMAIAQYLSSRGYSAPAILAHDEDAGLLLLEDLGEDSFTAVLRRNPGMEEELYAAAIDLLVEWHDATHGLANPAACPLPPYDEARLMREVMTVADWFLPQAIGLPQAKALRDEYEALWKRLIAAAPLEHNYWVHLDYHADNLMWLPSRRSVQRIGLLDFQDSVHGDAAYDIMSLLGDARRDVLPALAEAMLARYLAGTGADRERFGAAYAFLGAQRNSKIVGYFVRLAVRDGKLSYLNYLPRVWRHLENDLKHPALAELRQWLDRHVPADKRGVISLRSPATVGA